MWNSVNFLSMLPFIPVYDEDIFLKFRPFPAEPQTLWAAHWHEVVGSIIFYVIIQKLAPVFSKIWLGSKYTTLDRRTKINFDIHVVAMVQCILSIVVLLPMWNHPLWQNRLNDVNGSILGATPYGGFVSSFTAGYFIWDLYVCLVHFSMFGVGFLMHALSALVVFGSTLYPFCMPWIPAFLIFELSSPFVNINWFASKVGCFSEKVVMINGLCLLVTFFFVRIVWGFYAVAIVFVDMYKIWGDLPFVLPYLILSINVLLNSLNIYWFKKMVQIAMKKASGKKSTKKVVKEVAEKID